MHFSGYPCTFCSVSFSFLVERYWIAQSVCIYLVARVESWEIIDIIFSSITVQQFISYFLPFAQFLAAANSSVNPIIYGFVNRKYRIEIRVNINLLEHLHWFIFWYYLFFQKVIASCFGFQYKEPVSSSLDTVHLRLFKSNQSNKNTASS